MSRKTDIMSQDRNINRLSPGDNTARLFQANKKNQEKELVKTGLIIGATLLSMLAVQFIEAIVLQLTGIYSSAAFKTSTAQNLLTP